MGDESEPLRKMGAALSNKPDPAPAATAVTAPASPPGRTAALPDAGYELQLPDELTSLPAWLVWRYESGPDDKKPRKVPYYATGGRRSGTQGSPDDVAKLAPFDESVAAFQKGGYSGVGLAMLPQSDLVGLDFDDCIDQDGNVNPAVEALVAGTYAEISPSGTGVRAFMRGTLADRKDNSPDSPFRVEVFHAKGFLTVTGRALEICKLLGSEKTVEPLTDEVIALYEDRFGRKPHEPRERQSSGDSSDLARAVKLANVTDETVDHVRQAVLFLGAKWADDYDKWVPKVGHALKSLEQAGRAEANGIWHAFSALSSKYDYDQAQEKWEGINPNSITYTSIFKWADDAEWVNPKSKAARAHDPLAEIDAIHLTTDQANATRLAKHHGDDLAYIPGGWLAWNGATHWEGGDAASMRFGMRLSRIIAGEVADLGRRAQDMGSEGERDRLLKTAEALAKFGARAEDANKITSALKLAKARLARSVTDFDSDPCLLNCQNGTVDLRTGELREHRREDRLTRIAPIAYIKTAARGAWERFLSQIIPDADVVAFLKRFLGYCLTGLTREQVMLVFWGGGANGKSTLINMLKAALGPYAQAAPPRLLEDSRGDRHPTEIADLWNTRLVFASETGEGTRLREEFIKYVTGSERLKARFMREDFFEFDPTHKLILSTNHKPIVVGNDYAIWRRLLLVPFGVTFGSAEEVASGARTAVRDPALTERLQAEREGVLAWLVEGCMEWQRDGLRPPTAVLAATESYRDEMDKVGLFLKECCTVGPQESAGATALFTQFRWWCRENGYPDASQRWFGLRLGERGFQREEKRDGVQWVGLRLLPPDLSV